jgi:large subunit ribosomal protein L14e
MPLFRKYAEVGRVCLVTYGPDFGKLCVILEIIDQNRALVDGPSTVTGVLRQQMNFKRLSLTNIKIKIHRSARLKQLTKAFNDAKVLEQWSKNSYAKKLENQKKRDSLNDFDRFKVMLARQRRSRIVKQEFNKLVRKHKSVRKLPIRHKAKLNYWKNRPNEATRQKIREKKRALTKKIKAKKAALKPKVTDTTKSGKKK